MTDEASSQCAVTLAASSSNEPDGRFDVTATIRYRVTWNCSGSCSDPSGALGLIDAPAGTGALRVLQRQTVVVQ